ncbi:MAG: type II secretion system protein GspM [Thalassotalea sp.]
MKDRWQALNQREQHLVIAMACFVGVFLFYLVIWQPVNDGIAAKEKKVKRQQELVVWMNDKKSAYTAANTGSQNNRNESLSTIVNRSASKQGIAIARVQPQGDEINISIDEVSFNILMDWLKNMAVTDGVSVKSVDLAKTDVKGVVKVRRLNLGKG